VWQICHDYCCEGRVVLESPELGGCGVDRHACRKP
jgi:hypothetical protein